MMRVLTNRAKTKASQLVRVLIAIVLVMTMSPTVPAYAQSESTTTPMKLDGTLFTSADIYSQEVALPEVLDELEREAIAQKSVQQQTVQIAQPQPASANVYRATVPVAQSQTGEDAISQGDPEPVSEPLEDKGAYPLSGEGAESASDAGESADASAGATSGTTLGITLEAADEYAISYDLNVPEGEEAKPAPASYAPKTVRFGEDTPLPDGDEPTLEGYTFLGWTDMPNGGTTYGSAQADWDAWGKSEKWDKLEGATLYAQWDSSNANARATVTKDAYFYANDPFTDSIQQLGKTEVRFVERNGKYYLDWVNKIFTPPTYTGHKFKGFLSSCGENGAQVQVTDANNTFSPSKDIACNLGGSDNFIIIVAEYEVTGTWITFNSNGGNSYTVERRMAESGKATPSAPMTPSHGSGLKFMGWYDAAVGGTQYLNDRGASVKNWDKSVSSCTLYAHWGTLVSFNSNGGNSFSYSAYAVNGEPTPVPSSLPTKSGSLFAGWFDNSGAGSGNQYISDTNQSVKNWNKIERNATLYAHWGVQITYDPNGGDLSGSNTRVVEAGLNTPNSPSGSPSRSGYFFCGWYDSRSDGTMYVDGSGNSVRRWDKGAGTLYARWANVAYNANNGSDPTIYNPKMATSGQPTPTPDNYGTGPTYGSLTLLGWFDAQTGGTKYLNANGTSVKNWDKTTATTLYAQWSGQTVVYNENGVKSRSYGSKSVALGSPTPKPDGGNPVANGFTFAGWYDHPTDGNRYLDENGNSVRTWDKNQPLTTLYAHWTRNAGTTVDVKFKTDGANADLNFKFKEDASSAWDSRTYTEYNYRGYVPESGKTVVLKPGGDHLFIYNYTTLSDVQDATHVYGNSSHACYVDYSMEWQLPMSQIDAMVKNRAITSLDFVLHETFTRPYKGEHPNIAVWPYRKGDGTAMPCDARFKVYHPVTGETILDETRQWYTTGADRASFAIFIDPITNTVSNKAPLPSKTIVSSSGDKFTFHGYGLSHRFSDGWYFVTSDEGVLGDVGRRGDSAYFEGYYTQGYVAFNVNLPGLSDTKAQSYFPLSLGSRTSNKLPLDKDFGIDSNSNYWSIMTRACSDAGVKNSMVKGWYTAKEGGTMVLDARGKKVNNVDPGYPRVLYAQWTDGYYNINYKADGKGVAEDKVVPIPVGDSFLTANVVLDESSYTYQDQNVIAWYDKNPYSNTDAYFIGLPGATVPLTSCSSELWALYGSKDKYTLIFDKNYNSIASTRKDVNRGSDYPLHEDPTRAGYEFQGWKADGIDKLYKNGSSVPSSTIEVLSNFGKKAVLFKAQWKAGQSAYKVEYYKKDINKNEYVLLETVNKTGTTDTQATAEKKTITGYTINPLAADYKESGNIEGDGSLVLKLHYDPNIYTVSYSGNGNATGSAPASATNGYNTDFKTATNTGNLARPHYTLKGWKPSGKTTVYALGSTISAADMNSISSNATKAVTLNAEWEPVKYKITFNKQSGTGGTDSIDANYNSDMPTISVPTRTGYTFGGYFDAENGGGTQYYKTDGTSNHKWDKGSAATLYAKWTANSYTVTFNDNWAGAANPPESKRTPNTYSATMTYDAVVKGPSGSAPARVGYTLLGWFDAAAGGIQYLDASGKPYNNKVWDKPQDTTLYAHWSCDTYIYTFDPQGGSGGHARQLPYVDYQTLSRVFPANPTREGYDFLGWFDSRYWGNKVSSSTEAPAQDKTYYAQWASTGNPDAAGAIGTTVTSKLFAQVTSTFYLNDSASGDGVDYGSVTQKAGTDTVKPANYKAPTRPGLTFGGWYDKKIAESAPIPSDAKKYLNADGTSANKWDKLDDTRLYGYWSGNQVKVTFDAQGGTFDNTSAASFTMQYASGAKFGTSRIPAITPAEGFEFIGWFTHPVGGSQITSDSLLPAIDTTYYAHYSTTSDPGAKGAKNTDVKSKLYMRTALTLDANFPAIGGSTTINGKKENGSYKGIDVSYGEKMPKPSDYTAAPTKEGWVFMGWYSAASGGTKYLNADGSATDNTYAGLDSTTKMAPDTAVLYGQWKAAEVEFTWDLNGGNVSGSKDALSTKIAFATGPDATTPNKVSMPASQPTKSNARFVGWYTDKNADTATRISSQTECPASAVTYYAQWAYEITLEGNGATTAPSPDKIYYWANHGYTLDVPDYKNDSTSAPTLIKTDGTATSIVSVGKTGHTLTSFVQKNTTTGQTTSTVCLDSPVYDTKTKLWSAKLASTAPAKLEAAQTWVAQWTPGTYTVKYDAQGGLDASGNAATYADKTATYGVAAPAPDNYVAPVRPGFTLLGWYATKIADNTDTTTAKKYLEADGTPTTGQLWDIDDDATLYARWSGNSINLTYDAQGGSFDSTSAGKYTKRFEAGATIGAENIPVVAREGYTFVGWFTDQFGGGGKVVPDMLLPSVDTTYYAHWTNNDPSDPDDPKYDPDDPAYDPEAAKGVEQSKVTSKLYMQTTITYDPNWDGSFGSGTTNGAKFSDAMATYGVVVPGLANKTAPAKDGNTFLGWFDGTGADAKQYLNANGTPVKDADKKELVWDKLTDGLTPDTWTLYGHWKASGYKVTFDSEGGQPEKFTADAEYGSDTPKPSDYETPKRAGFTLLGWYDEEKDDSAEHTSDYDAAHKYMDPDGTSKRTWDKAADATLHAHWVGDDIEVTFKGQGGTFEGDATAVLDKVKTKQYADGATLSGIVPSISRENYTFAGWYTEQFGGEAVTAETALPTASGTVYWAHWERSYDDSDSESANGASLVQARVHMKTTLSFDPNFAAAPGSEEEVSDTYDDVVAYYWEAIDAADVFKDKKQPSKAGYTFLGWFGGTEDDAKQYLNAEGVAKDAADADILWDMTDPDSKLVPKTHTLYGHWKANEYVVAYDANGGMPEELGTKKATYNADTPKPDTMPTRNLFAFEGFYDVEMAENDPRIDDADWVAEHKYIMADGSSAQVWNKVADATLYAHWVGNEINITWDANGGTVNGAGSFTKHFATGATIGADNVPGAERAGYTFDGWYTDVIAGGSVDGDTLLPESDATYYAHWTSLDPEDPDDPKYDPDDPAYDPEAAKGLAQSKITSKMYMQTTVKYDANRPTGDGTADDNTYADAVATYGAATPVLDESEQPSKEGFDFLGWFTEAGRADAEGNAPEYQVLDEEYVKAHKILNADGSAYRESWTGDDLLDSDKLAHDTLTLYGRWQAKGVILTWDLAGGEIGEGEAASSEALKTVVPYRADAKVIMPAQQPAKDDDAVFVGWYADATTSTTRISASTACPAVDTTYYAQWAYPVTLVGKDADEDKQQTIDGLYLWDKHHYTLEIGEFTNALADNPVDIGTDDVVTIGRTGYDLVGYMDGEGDDAVARLTGTYDADADTWTAKLVDSAPVDVGAAQTWTAEWTPSEYTVTYDSKGGTPASYAGKKVHTGEATPVPGGTPTRDGMRILGWYDEPQADEFDHTAAYDAEHKYLDVDHTGATTSLKEWFIPSDAVLYAHWEQSRTTKLSFDLNSGEGTAPEGLVATKRAPMPAYGQSAPTLEGFVFQGFFDAAQGGVQYYTADLESALDWDKNDEEYTLIAHWLPKDYAEDPDRPDPGRPGYYPPVDPDDPDNPDNPDNPDKIWKTALTFDVNGGTGAVPTDLVAQYHYDMPAYGMDKPTRVGYDFAGYYNKAEAGEGRMYYDADLKSASRWINIDETATLYAHWTPIEYTVSYDANAADDESLQNGDIEDGTATYDAPAPAPSKTPSRSLYVIEGWYDEPIADNAAIPDTATKYLKGDGTPYTYTDEDGAERTQVWDKAQSATLYAHWVGSDIYITWDAQGGSFQGTNADIYTQAVPVPYDPTKFVYELAPSVSRTDADGAAYSFAGWFTDPFHGVQVDGIDTPTPMPTASVTYYAHWTSNNPEDPDDPKYDPDDPAYDPEAAKGLAQSKIISKMHMTTKLALDDNVPEGETLTAPSAFEGDYEQVYGAAITQKLGDGGRAYTAPKIEGWSFGGWGAKEAGSDALIKYFEADGSPAADAVWKAELGEDGFTEETTTLYAIWQGDDVTVTLVPMGGTFASNDWTELENGSIEKTRPYETGASLDAPKVYRKGYDFAGWYTDAISGEKVEQMPKQSAVYYAHWTTIDPDDPNKPIDPDPDDPNSDPTDPEVAAGTKQTDIVSKMYMASPVELVDNFPVEDEGNAASTLGTYQHVYGMPAEDLADHEYSSPSANGFALEGWYDSETGGTMIFDAAGAAVAGEDGNVPAWKPALDDYTASDAVVKLYARWSAEVVLHATGATGDFKDDQTIRADVGGKLHTTMPDGSAIRIPERADYTFAGWGLEGAKATEAYLTYSGGALTATDKLWQLGDSRDFYPIWISDAFVITFDKGVKSDGTAWADDDTVTVPASMTIDLDDVLTKDDLAASANEAGGQPRYRVSWWYITDEVNKQGDPGSADGQGAYRTNGEDGFALSLKANLQAAGYAVDGSTGMALPPWDENGYRHITLVPHWDVLKLRISVPTAVAFWAKSNGAERQVLTPEAGAEAGKYRMINYGDATQITNVAGTVHSDAFKRVFPGTTTGLKVTVGGAGDGDAQYQILDSNAGKSEDTSTDTALSMPLAATDDGTALPLKLAMDLPNSVPMAYLPTDSETALGDTAKNTKFMRVVYTVKLAKDVTNG